MTQLFWNAPATLHSSIDTTGRETELARAGRLKDVVGYASSHSPPDGRVWVIVPEAGYPLWPDKIADLAKQLDGPAL